MRSNAAIDHGCTLLCTNDGRARPCDFWMLWADGHGRQPSQSRLLFCDRTGATFVLPETMADDSVKPTAARAR